MIKKLVFGVVAVLVLLLSVLLGLQVGSFQADTPQVLQALLNYNPENPVHFAIIELRLPRLLLAFTVGASLAFAGYLMQAMVNNALADPFIMGTASGASLGAASCFFLLGNLTFAGFYLPPLGAFAGALLVTGLVVALGYRKGQLIPSQMLLAGIALSSLLTALIGLMSFLSQGEGQLRAIIFWMMGGFEQANWRTLPYPALALLISLILYYFLQKQVNILLLGATRADALGVNIRKLRWLMLGTISVVTGFAVALAGPVGFVGLIVPHITRSLLGAAGKTNLLLCAFIGGTFVLLCDLLARGLYPPAGVPIGIITALFGVPFFVYLLLRKNYKFNE